MKTEVRRGRKFVEYHDPDTQAPNTFTQEISGADVSYQDEQGRWQQLVEDWETDGADGFSFRASRMNHKVRFDSIGAWRWYPRRNVETEYLVINRPQCWLTATKRWGNLLVNGISREGKDITLTSVRNVTRVIHSRWNGIKTDWILLNANAPTRFRQKIDLVGITEVDGVLYGADGEKLGVLTPTTATDANGAELPCTGSYVNGYVEFQADVSGAVYPVTIDPDFSVQPNETAGKDTKLKQTSPTTNYGTGTELEISCWDPATDVQNSLIAFDYSSIPEDSIITNGTISLVRKNGKGTYLGYAYRMLVDWVEGEATWEKRNSTTNWNTAGANGSGTDRYSTATDSQYTNSNVTFNVKNDIQSFVDGTNNYGWVLISEIPSERYLQYAVFYSSSETTESNRPSSSVTYTTSGTLLKVNMNGQMQNLSGGFN